MNNKKVLSDQKQRVFDIFEKCVEEMYHSSTILKNITNTKDEIKKTGKIFSENTYNKVMRLPEFKAFYDLVSCPFYINNTLSLEKIETHIKFLNDYVKNSSCFQILMSYVSKFKPEYTEDYVLGYMATKIFGTSFMNNKEISIFDHLFIGMDNEKKLSGIHNWIRLLFIERNFKEFKIELEEENKIGFVVKIFDKKDNCHKMSTMLSGASPSFAICFFALGIFVGIEEHVNTINNLELLGENYNLNIYVYRDKMPITIYFSFPSIDETDCNVEFDE